MLGTIANFIKTIMGLITSLVQIVVSFVGDIVHVVKLCVTFVAKIPQLFSFFPSEVLALIVACFGVVMVYKILGREG